MSYIPLLFAMFLLCVSGASSGYANRKTKSEFFEDRQRDFEKEWLEEGRTQQQQQHHHHHHHHHETKPSVVDEEDLTVTDKDHHHQQQQQQHHNCSRCAASQERKAIRLAGIRNQILSQLGLKKPPNVTGINIPNAPPLENLLDHYNMQADYPGQNFVPGPEYGEEDEFHITTEKVLSFAQTPPTRHLLEEGEHVLYFKFSGSITTSHVQSAHLWIYVRPNHLIPQRNITLFQILRNANSDYPELIQVRRKTIDRSSKHGHWIVFDVKKFILHWFRHPKDNNGFLIRSSSPDPTEFVLDYLEETKESARPFIDIKVEKQKHRRSKRMIGLNCEENSNEVRCCRYPLTVDFEEFGWDWIIAPKRYEANYCSGECPYVFLQKYPHTHLVQQANPQGSAGPCCAPRKMSAISMLYFDEDHNIIYGMLPGMVVDRCGCS